MKLHILNVSGGELCLSQGFGNRSCGLVRRLAEADAMKRFASGSVASEFGIDTSAASSRMVMIFEYEHPGTLGQHEAVAICGKRPRSALGCVVPLRSKGAQHRVSLNNSRCDGGIDSAHQEHWLHPCL